MFTTCENAKPKSLWASHFGAFLLGCAVLAPSQALAQSTGELGASSSASIHISLRLKPRITLADDGSAEAGANKRKCLAIWSRTAELSLTRQNGDVIELSADASCQIGSATGYSFSAKQDAERGTMETIIVSPQ